MPPPTDKELQDWLIKVQEPGSPGSHFIYVPFHNRTCVFVWACDSDDILNITHLAQEAKYIQFFSFSLRAIEEEKKCTKVTVSSKRPYRLKVPTIDPAYEKSVELTLYVGQFHSRRPKLGIVSDDGAGRPPTSFGVIGTCFSAKRKHDDFEQELHLV